jgi:hypothetical protein
MLLAVVLMVLAEFMQSSTLGMGVHVSERLVSVLMSMNRIVGLAIGWESQTLARCSHGR